MDAFNSQYTVCAHILLTNRVFDVAAVAVAGVVVVVFVGVVIV